MATHVGGMVDWPVTDEVAGRKRWRALRAVVESLVGQVRRPPAARRVAELAPAERVLAYACDTTETSVVATDRALHRLEGEGPAERWSRWPWEQVARVSWDTEANALTVTGLLPALPGRSVLRFRERVALVDLALERVTWTRQLDVRVGLGQYGAARVTVRRQPGSDRMFWVVRPDDGVDTEAPEVQAELDAALVALRADTGL